MRSLGKADASSSRSALKCVSKQRSKAPLWGAGPTQHSEMHRHLTAQKSRKQEERGGKTRSTAEEFALHASAPMPVYRVRVLDCLDITPRLFKGQSQRWNSRVWRLMY